jgi:hypothetical protein
MTMSFLGKGIMSLPPRSLLSSMPWLRDPEIKKFFLMSQSLSLCLMGYAWFGQPSLRSHLKWSIGGHALCLLLHAAIVTCPTLEPPASLSLPPS